MRQSTITKLQELHKKVIHDVDCTEEEYLQEDKVIKAINGEWLLSIICNKCFPVLDKPKIKWSVRTAEQYDIRYPIKRIVDVDEWNNRLAKK